MTAKQPFETVVAVHGPTVLRVCRAVLGAVDADDAWSETFLSAMKAYPDLPADANVEAWLVTIAHRKAIDVTRATARRAIPTDDLPETAHDTRRRTGPRPRRGARAAAATSRRQAVAYHYLAGLPHADVAAILGGSTDAARRAAADGIATLRRTYPRRHHQERRTPMNTEHDLTRDLARAYDAAPEHMRALQARLAAAAQRRRHPRRRLPHRRQPGRLAAARRDRSRARPRRLRQREPRRGPADPVRPHKPPRPQRPRPPRCRGPRAG